MKNSLTRVGIADAFITLMLPDSTVVDTMRMFMLWLNGKDDYVYRFDIPAHQCSEGWMGNVEGAGGWKDSGRGERSTAVFSICTAGQYLGGVMLPGIVSGLISESIGYQNFFLLIMALCLVTFAVTAFVKIEK